MRMIDAAKLADLDLPILSAVDGSLDLSLRDNRKIISALSMCPFAVQTAAL